MSYYFLYKGGAVMQIHEWAFNLHMELRTHPLMVRTDNLQIKIKFK
jgi:hypothetical protein